LLSETDLTVAAIGRLFGYPDLSYFIKRFRDEHRMTPVQWRTRTTSGRDLRDR
jgi:AraC family transcriptional activator of pobA